MLQQKYIQILKSEKLQLGVVYTLSFLIPFFLPKPQIILGTIINLILIYSVSKFTFKQMLPLFILPSISSFLNNLLFGTSTVFLLYLIPFISLSNFAFVYVFKEVNKTYLNIILASCTKAFILYFCTLILVKVTNMPDMFLTIMGGIQLITALMGGGLAILILKDTPSS
jgi:uncharacterized membrane protein